ncbi:MAG: rhomboid family intramembrane serine protease [Candidatus Tectomicrobia bacterium]|uniref:Rhomboid family intramembrane serine protease n=1 Tax=Tectimicrobiota bacterium TaxID=2528274 RepID=A0A932I1L0_UNCTE|nr:rhomboid family intramembrane serine protease [Candidatus Tectomicrobia bacterium]
MLPLWDDVTKDWRAPLTWLLILANTAISLYVFNLPPDGQAGIVERYAFLPNLHESLSPRLLTSAYLHGDYLHLISNMVFLFAFGPSLERRLGRISFLALYHLAALAGWLLYAALAREVAPAIGASGAVSGLVAAYILLFPRARIFTAVWLVWFWRAFYIPAWVYIPVWIAIQLAGALNPEETEIAYLAHIGGILLGLGWGGVARMRRR